MGLAAIRDVTAFLRRERGPTDPLAADGQSGISRAIGLGISQSGRVLRDVLYYGMNGDEAGRLVFEAMMPIIPGARRSFTNDRFAEPGRNPGPEFDRLYPVLRFPFTYAVTEDVYTGRRDGLLLRCSQTNSCPRIMQIDLSSSSGVRSEPARHRHARPQSGATARGASLHGRRQPTRQYRERRRHP